MGWGRMLLLGNLGQQLDINETQDALNALSAQICSGDRDVARTVADLARENAELKLYLAATVRLLVANHGINTAELTEIVHTIDPADGAADGQLRGKLSSQL